MPHRKYIYIFLPRQCHLDIPETKIKCHCKVIEQSVGAENFYTVPFSIFSFVSCMKNKICVCIKSHFTIIHFHKKAEIFKRLHAFEFMNAFSVYIVKRKILLFCLPKQRYQNKTEKS